MIIREGKIILNRKDFNKTVNIEAEQLICGHYLIPVCKDNFHLQKVYCPVCQRMSRVMGNIVIQRPEDLLK